MDKFNKKPKKSQKFHRFIPLEKRKRWIVAVLVIMVVLCGWLYINSLDTPISGTFILRYDNSGSWNSIGDPRVVPHYKGIVLESERHIIKGSVFNYIYYSSLGCVGDCARTTKYYIPPDNSIVQVDYESRRIIYENKSVKLHGWKHGNIICEHKPFYTQGMK